MLSPLHKLRRLSLIACGVLLLLQSPAHAELTIEITGAGANRIPLAIADFGGEPGVSRGSAAEKAGLKEGDVILEFNGKKITLQNTLAAQIGESAAGEAVTLTIFRDGKTLEVSVILGEKE